MGRVQCELRFLACTEMWRSRNSFASIISSDQDMSHLLFTDSDMAFGPTAVTRLLPINTSSRKS